MKNAEKFLQLIRWPNLLFIAITQILFYTAIFNYVFRTNHISTEEIKLTWLPFLLILFASQFIAAAGYIINDYFDVGIDKINKADKVFIGKYLKAKTAFFLYASFSLAGLILTAVAAWQLQNLYILLFNFLAIFLLLFYSASFKRKFLTGNIIVSILTAWTIIILASAEYPFFPVENSAWQTIMEFALLYGGFAFLISMIREVIKDMEDVEGDRQFGCTTMPVVSGIKKSRAYTRILILVLIITLIVSIKDIFLQGRWMIAVYTLLLIVLPLIFILQKLLRANSPKDFHYLSQLSKLVMLTGVLSMIFFYFAK